MNDSADPEARVRELLGEIYLPGGVDIWLTKAAYPSFDGATAQELLDAGRGDVVLAEVQRLVGGAW